MFSTFKFSGRSFVKKAALFLVPAIIAFGLIFALVAPGNAFAVPIINISSVVPDTSVTIYGYNFPTGQTFTVRMGPYGSYGIGGTVVGTKAASSTTTFTANYTIPAALVGSAKIAIRMDSAEGFYSYNWFYNTTAPAATPAAPVPPPYVGIPTFSISAVTAGTSVTVVTSNAPAGQDYTVRMGDYGTYGIGGIVIGTYDSGSGGAFTKTFAIPAALAANGKIAIRMDYELGNYSYNWFYNNTAPVPVPPAPVPAGYYGYPTFSITAVVKDSTVTISAYNVPPDQNFTVRMGTYGSYAVGGTVVGTFTSGSGGSFTQIYNIPASLAGKSKIAIRFDNASGYYYAFNWFYNNTTY